MNHLRGKKWTKEIQKNLDFYATAQSSTANVVNTHGENLRTLNDSVRGISERLDKVMDDQSHVMVPLQNLKERVEQSLGNVEFPQKKTVVCQNVWYTEGEDLNKVVELIINTTLELPEIKVLNIKRMSGRESGSGTLKVELESVDAVKTVLKEKHKLSTAPAYELREIFLRQSKSEETLVAERNQDTILREMGVRDNYVRLQNGHLTRRQNRYSPRGTRGRPDSHSGRGGHGSHGGRGRGARGSYAKHAAPRDWNTTNERGRNKPDVPIGDLLA